MGLILKLILILLGVMALGGLYLFWVEIKNAPEVDNKEPLLNDDLDLS